MYHSLRLWSCPKMYEYCIVYGLVNRMLFLSVSFNLTQQKSVWKKAGRKERMAQDELHITNAWELFRDSIRATGYVDPFLIYWLSYGPVFWLEGWKPRNKKHNCSARVKSDSFFQERKYSCLHESDWKKKLLWRVGSEKNKICQGYYQEMARA